MRGEMRALHELAAIAREDAPSAAALETAAQILRLATGAAEVLIVYAEDQEFLLARDGQPPTPNDITPAGLRIVQRQLLEGSDAITFRLTGHRVGEFGAASSGNPGEYLALRVPTTEGSSEMCLLRGPWPRQALRRVVRFAESALPALTLLMERSLNAERSRRHQQQLEALANAAQVLTRAQDIQPALTELTSAIASSAGFDYVSMDVYDADTQRFMLRALNENRWADTSLAQVWLNSFDPDRPDEFAAAILRSRKPWLAADVQDNESISELMRAFFKRALLTSAGIFPMLFQEELLGTMAFVSYKPHAFPPDEVEALQSVANQMATALKAMRMYAELARSREEISQYARRIERQQGKLRRQAATLRVMASTDALTGASSYGRLHETIDRQLERAQRAGKPLSLILADVDDFKLFNDTYGHLAGDEALKALVAAFRGACRRKDVVARYGGDEFMVVLPNTEAKRAARVAERVLDEVARWEFRPQSATEAIPLAVSIGIASYPEDGKTKDALIGRADAAMYDSKGFIGKILGPGQTGDGQERVRYPLSAFGMLDGLVRAIDRKDRYTRSHSEKDAEYAVQLGEAIGVSVESLRALRIAGLLHDVGKIGVPERILRKPGALTQTEREVMEQHVLITERMIGDIPHLEDVLAAASSHHEHFDGTGYPRGLKGEQIPLLGRVLAVADAFSAMTDDRPYRKALSWSRATRELRMGAGTQFDPAVVESFLEHVLPQLERRKDKAA